MVRPNDKKGSLEGKDKNGRHGIGLIPSEINPQEFYTRKNTRNKNLRTRKHDQDTEKDDLPLKQRPRGLTHGKPDTENLGNSSILTVGLLQGES